MILSTHCFIIILGKGSEKMKVLQGFRLIDGSGRAALDDALLVIENDKIKTVGKSGDVPLPAGGEVTDLTGKTVLPGLIDAHVHLFFNPVADPLAFAAGESDNTATLRAAGNGQKTLRSGITTVRDLGWRSFACIDLRNAVAGWVIEGPRILTCGQFLTMTGGHVWPCGFEADGPEELRKGARLQLKAGADLIKLMATGGVLTPGVEPGSSQLDEEEMRAAIVEAKKAGKGAAAHAQGTEGIKNAIRAGVSSIEHGMILDEEAVSLLLERDVYLVPTLSAPYWISRRGSAEGIPDYMMEKNNKIMEQHKVSFRMAYEAGVKIAMGTDAGTPFNEHGSNCLELKLMVEQGMQPLEAITAATLNSARLLGIEAQAGTVTPGKEADLLVLNSNPLQDMAALSDIHSVYKGGRLLS